MARQLTNPVSFGRTIRRDTAVLMTSGRAGVVTPLAHIPILPGDTASGTIGFDFQIREMPKPLLNAVGIGLQVWFVPKPAMPQFSSREELNHAMTEQPIHALGMADRNPPPYYHEVDGAALTTVAASTFFKTLGLHIPAGQKINADLVDAFNVIYNFRLAAHSSRLQRKKYVVEDLDEAIALPPAFWPSSRLSAVVPDYERALVVGALDLDVSAGMLPITGTASVTFSNTFLRASASPDIFPDPPEEKDMRLWVGDSLPGGNARVKIRATESDWSPDENALITMSADGATVDTSALFANMSGSSIGITLADIDKARTTQAFAKLRTAYAGNDATGFDNDDTIVALLMQGIRVDPDSFKRPWLLASQRIAVGFGERFSTDADALEQSITVGRASAALRISLPIQDTGGIIIATAEMLPERVDERMSDEWLHMTKFEQLPNALRDIQRVEPVDLVLNRRIDAKHTSPDGLYGFEPMNNVWNRDFTRLGGEFYLANPGGGFSENRATIWQAEIVDPVYSTTHFLAPSSFPHDVFSDQSGPAYEAVVRHLVTISGNTQIGDVLVENSDDYDAVHNGGLPPAGP